MRVCAEMEQPFLYHLGGKKLLYVRVNKNSEGKYVDPAKKIKRVARARSDGATFSLASWNGWQN